jgi:hypothetical protein
MSLGFKIGNITFILVALFAATCLGAENNSKLHTTIGRFDSVGLTSKVYMVFINTTRGVESFYLDEHSEDRYFDQALTNIGRPVKVVWRYGKSYDTPYSSGSKVIKSIRFLRKK